MKTYNVANLMTAAAYVRNETIISGTQAAYLDSVTGSIKTYLASVDEAPRKIEELTAAGKERGANMWRRTLERDKKELAELCAQLHAWLVDFKTNRPNVQINLDEPETTNTEDTPATMNANETAANIDYANRIAKVITGAKCRGAWQNGVKTYALMLLDWYKEEASESPLTLETMLNGAKDWRQYAYGGAGVAQCYNAAIAETLCSPSELKRTKGGAKAPNSNETWCDVEARALSQAWQAIKQAELLPQF